MTLHEQDIVNDIPISELLQNINARVFSLHEENRRLKKKKPKWHKVADGDLPKETEFIESDVLLLLVQLKGTENKRYELGRYYFSGNVFVYPHLKVVEDVVAWCEIPRFEEA